MSLIKFSLGDILIMKKKHPCGSDRFAVLRLGSDVRISCVGCKRDLTIKRESLEKSIKSIEAKNEEGR